MSKRGHGEGSIVQLSDGRWQGRLMVGYHSVTGKPIRKAVYGKTQKEARDKLKALSLDIKNGLKLSGGKQSFGDWLDTWLENHVKISTRLTTYENYCIMVKLHIKPILGRVRMDKLKADDIQTLLHFKLEGGDTKPLANKTVRLIHMIIHRALKQAVANGLVVRNVAESVTKPKIIKKEISCKR